MAFLTIHLAPNLSRSQHRQAALAGPPAVITRDDHQSMLRRAGFEDIQETDVTADYLATVRAWFDHSSAREAELRQVVGDAMFEARQLDRQLQMAAIERGLLRRSLFTAFTAHESSARREAPPVAG